MNLLLVQKFKFSGPDPPADPPKKEEEEQVEEVKSPPAKGKKEEVPVEIELTEEEKAELKMFEDFVGEFAKSVDQVKTDLSSYRALIHPDTGVDRRALWPKTFSPKEIENLRKAEEARLK